MKKLSLIAIYECVQRLHNHLSNTDLNGKFGPIWGERFFRIYYRQDGSYLFIDEWGNVVAGLKGSTPKELQNCQAQKAINTYSLDKQSFRPPPATEPRRHRSVCPGAVQVQSGFRKPKKKWD